MWCALDRCCAGCLDHCSSLQSDAKEHDRVMLKSNANAAKSKLNGKARQSAPAPPPTTTSTSARARTDNTSRALNGLVPKRTDSARPLKATKLKTRSAARCPPKNGSTAPNPRRPPKSVSIKSTTPSVPSKSNLKPSGCKESHALSANASDHPNDSKTSKQMINTKRHLQHDDHDHDHDHDTSSSSSSSDRRHERTNKAIDVGELRKQHGSIWETPAASQSKPQKESIKPPRGAPQRSKKRKKRPHDERKALLPSKRKKVAVRKSKVSKEESPDDSSSGSSPPLSGRSASAPEMNPQPTHPIAPVLPQKRKCEDTGFQFQTEGHGKGGPVVQQPPHKKRKIAGPSGLVMHCELPLSKELFAFVDCQRQCIPMAAPLMEWIQGLMMVRWHLMI